ncbi:hypothetical protein ACFXTH_029937 [Malus domestica]
MPISTSWVMHIIFFGRLSNFEFTGKDFETFSISLEYLLAFTYEACIGEVVGEVGAQLRVTGDEALDDAAAQSVMAVERVVTE